MLLKAPSLAQFQRVAVRPAATSEAGTSADVPDRNRLAQAKTAVDRARAGCVVRTIGCATCGCRHPGAPGPAPVVCGPCVKTGKCVIIPLFTIAVIRLGPSWTVACRLAVPAVPRLGFSSGAVETAALFRLREPLCLVLVTSCFALREVSFNLINDITAKSSDSELSSDSESSTCGL